MLTDDRAVLAIAVEQGVQGYYDDKHKLYQTMHENEMQAAGAKVAGSSMARLREDKQRVQEAVEALHDDMKVVAQRKSRSVERQNVLRNALREQEQRLYES